MAKNFSVEGWSLESEVRKFNRRIKEGENVIYYPFKMQGMFTSACRVKIVKKAFINSHRIPMVWVTDISEPVPMITISKPKLEVEFKPTDKDQLKRWDYGFTHAW